MVAVVGCCFRMTFRAAGDRDLEVVVAVTTRPPVLKRDFPGRLLAMGMEMVGWDLVGVGAGFCKR